MEELYNIFNELIPLFKVVAPVILACGFFHFFLRISMRMLRGDVVLYRKHNEPDTNVPDTKDSESFDIPEKQKDFIQLN